jgi:hypothetical protein
MLTFTIASTIAIHEHKQHVAKVIPRTFCYCRPCIIARSDIRMLTGYGILGRCDKCGRPADLAMIQISKAS